MSNATPDIAKPQPEFWEPSSGLQRVYIYYRLVLSTLLVALYFGDYSWKVAGSLHPDLYLGTSITYAVLNILSLKFLLDPNAGLNRGQRLISAIIDLLVVILVSHASGGINSGLYSLLLISIGATSIFFTGRMPMLIAAATSIAIIGDNILLSFNHPDLKINFMACGMLGLLCFATALIVQTLAEHIRTSEIVTAKAAARAAHMLELNQLIVQRMRTGILVVADDGEIRMANEAAVQLLDLDQSAVALKLQDDLQSRFEHWRELPMVRPAPFKVDSSRPEIQANFASLSHAPEEDNETLIFLEDTSKIAQQAQHLKLASLGRLTASIAHEIRNPLGAISHAAQLLQESEALNPADLRLAGIIHDHSRRMNKVIENVLELSRRKASKPESLPLQEWLQSFREEFSAGQNEPVEIAINVEPKDLSVSYDPSHLSQVLSNLCNNGLRYSKQATGRARITIEAYLGGMNELPCLDVIDEGAGVDQDQQAQLFEPFYTTESTGTGLGLYISRELCEANQSRLDYVRNSAGKSCFKITFSHPGRIITL